MKQKIVLAINTDCDSMNAEEVDNEHHLNYVPPDYSDESEDF